MSFFHFQMCFGLIDRNGMISSSIREVSCVIQIVWIIPEELIKRVS
jgi:hypothetical protein